jgi:hypothetical protein
VGHFNDSLLLEITFRYTEPNLDEKGEPILMMNSEHFERRLAFAEQLLKAREAVDHLEHDIREASKKTDAKIKLLNDRIKRRMDSQINPDSSGT